jgi:hypothetical protein
MNIKTKKGKGFDIVSAINTITPKGIEFHLIDQADENFVGHNNIVKASFTGPNTNLEKRLLNYDSETTTYDGVVTPPINKLDAGAMAHDLSYSRYKNDLSKKHEADRVLVGIAEEVINDNTSTKIQKFNAKIVKIIIQGKLKLGLGVGGELVNQMPDKQTNTAGLIIGLVTLAGVIGVPALIKLINKNKK